MALLLDLFHVSMLIHLSLLFVHAYLVIYAHVYVFHFQTVILYVLHFVSCFNHESFHFHLFMYHDHYFILGFLVQIQTDNMFNNQ